MKLVADDLSGSQWSYQESVLCSHLVSVTNEFTIQEQYVDVNLRLQHEYYSICEGEAGHQ